MVAARIIALTFALVLALLNSNGVAADDAPDDRVPGSVAESAPLERLGSNGASSRALETSTSTAAESSGVRETSDRGSRSYQMFSTLGALVLGIIGLLWVRRNTAEL